MRTIRGIIAFTSVVLIYFSGCLSSLIYYPEKRIGTHPDEEGLSYEKVHFKTDDGIRLSGWWVPSKRQRGTVLLCHGNAGNISHRMESLKTFNRLGLNTLIFDYRGYGSSSGISTLETLVEDADVVLEKLFKEPFQKDEDIFGFGQSMGAYTLSRILPEYPEMKGAIIEAGLISFHKLFSDSFPEMEISIPSGEHLTTISGIKESNVGGTVAADLAHLGVTAIIIEHMAPKDEYYILKVNIDGEAELIDGKAYKGMRTYDLVSELKEFYGDKISITCIGPAGELKSLIAAIMHEKRAAGRSGVGAVMGSKRLKAIVARGTIKVPVADAAGLRDLRQSYGERAAARLLRRRLAGRLGCAPAPRRLPGLIGSG